MALEIYINFIEAKEKKEKNKKLLFFTFENLNGIQTSNSKKKEEEKFIKKTVELENKPKLNLLIEK